MPTKVVNILETNKLRIRGQYLDSVSYVLLHFLTLRLFENLAHGMSPHYYETWNGLTSIGSILRLNEASFMYKNLYVSADSNVKNMNQNLDLRISKQGITENNYKWLWCTYRLSKKSSETKSCLSMGHSRTKLWNSIPMNIRNSNTIIAFKSYMYQDILENQ